jgi:hypothetical protein
VRRTAATFAVLAMLCASRTAAAEITDVRGPVRVGWGYTGLDGTRALSLSFEDELALKHLGEGVALDLVFGMDGQRGRAFTGPNGQTLHRGFLGLTGGAGIEWRMMPGGPLATFNATTGPLWEAWSEDLVPHGLGVGARTELWPFYLNVKEIGSCEHGGFRMFVSSGLHGWALTRYDWLGADSGASWAVGFGVDLARNMVLPILDAAIGPFCARHTEQ